MELQKRCYGIFDGDGVIFDNVEENAQRFANILNRDYGISKETAVRIYKENGGLVLTSIFEAAFAEYGVTVSTDEIEKMALEFRSGIKDDQVKFFPDAQKVLRFLYCEFQMKLFLSSNSRMERLQKKLKDIKSCNFSAVLGSSDTIKKGIAHFMYFAGIMGKKPEEFFNRAFFVSDGLPDIYLALEFGIFPIGITTSVPEEKLREAGALVVIKSLSELPRILRPNDPRVIETTIDSFYH